MNDALSQKVMNEAIMQLKSKSKYQKLLRMRINDDFCQKVVSEAILLKGKSKSQKLLRIDFEWKMAVFPEMMKNGERHHKDYEFHGDSLSET